MHWSRQRCLRFQRVSVKTPPDDVRPWINWKRCPVASRASTSTPIRILTGRSLAFGTSSNLKLRGNSKRAIPLVESTIPAEQRTRMFRSARYLRKHAPISLNPEGPKWYEHSGHYLSIPYDLGSPAWPSTGKSGPTGMRQWSDRLHLCMRVRCEVVPSSNSDEPMRVTSMLYRRVDHFLVAFRIDISGFLLTHSMGKELGD